MIKVGDLIEQLCSNQNMNILEIWHPSDITSKKYFLTGDFRPSSGEVTYHSIASSTDITDILNTQSSLYANSPNSINSIVQAIENLSNAKKQTKKFDSSFCWIWHI